MIGAYPALTEARHALDEGHHEQAAQLVMSHLRAAPGEPRGLAMLGAVAMKTGALVQGEQFLRQAVARGYDTPEMKRDLASCLHQQERLAEALDLFRAIAATHPDDRQARASIATIADKLGRTDEARRIWETLAAEQPNKTAVWISLGHNLRFAGLTDKAIEAYRRAIGIEVDRGEAWWGLASIKTQVMSDEDIGLMERSLTTAADILNKAPLNFALGRAWHIRKDYEKAFRFFSEANRLWAEAINYNSEELTEEISEDVRQFDSSYFESLDRAGETSKGPIFIVSLPRSGSTLLEQMLGSHSDIEPLGELLYVPALLRSVMERATMRERATVPQAVAQLSPEDRRRLGEEYLRRALLHRQTDKPYFTDKLPHNWNNVIFIRHILPSARFVDIRRDPVDCCFANFSHSFTRAHSSSFALEHIGRAYVDYVRLMDHLGRAAPGMVHHMRYEQLIDEPERELSAALAYLGLPWDEACLRFYESKRTVRTPSAEQVRRPLNREGVGAWKPYKQWLGPLFDALEPVLKENQASAESA